MQRLSNSQLQNFLYQHENTSIDFKRDQYKFINNATDEEKSELLKDILAFANSWRENEAYIVIGVEDKKGEKNEVVGIQVHNRFDDANLQQLVKDKINRTIIFLYEEYPLDNKIIGIIRIPKQQRPFYAIKDFGKVKKEVVYHRLGSSTVQANPQQIYDMCRDDSLKEIEENQPLDKQRIDKFMDNLVKELKELSPDFTPYQSKPPEYKEVAQLIIDSLNNSDNLVIEFTEICLKIAITGNSECVERLYDKFSKIANLFNRSKDYSEISYEFSFDYFRIIGGRLFLILITCLVKEQKWDLISKILEKNLYIKDNMYSGLPNNASVDFTYLSQTPFSIWYKLAKDPYDLQLEDFFKKIDTDNLITLEEYKSADLFLYFYSQQWILTTIIQKITDIPRYLIEAEKQEYAINLSSVLGCNNIEELKTLLNQKIDDLRKFLSPNQPIFGVESTLFVHRCKETIANIGSE